MNRIKVRLTADCCGGIILTPINKRVRQHLKRAAVSGYGYDGTFFEQNASVEEWRERLPRSAFYERGKRFNDGAIFLMDAWEFSVMVGAEGR